MPNSADMLSRVTVMYNSQYQTVEVLMSYVSANSVSTESNKFADQSHTRVEITVPVFPRLTTSSIIASSVVVITLRAKLLTDIALV